MKDMILRSLRHSTARSCCQRVSELGKRLDHTSVSLTSDIYGRTLPRW